MVQAWLGNGRQFSQSNARTTIMPHMSRYRYMYTSQFWNLD